MIILAVRATYFEGRQMSDPVLSRSTTIEAFGVFYGRSQASISPIAVQKRPNRPLVRSHSRSAAPRFVKGESKMEGFPALFFSASRLYNSNSPNSEFIDCCLNQSNAWLVESAWSSNLPFGKVASSCRYSPSHGDLSGTWTKPFSIVLVTECTRMVLSIVGSYFLISCIPSL